MYKCNGCGEVFEQPKEARETHGFTDGTHETLSVCPCCSADYSEAEQCKQCGEWHFEDEIFGGLCADCITDEVDYITAHDYLRTVDDALNIFIFEKWLDSSVPKKSSEKVDLLCSRLYWEAVNEERAAESDKLLRKVRGYIIEEDGDFGKADFAEWLNERRCKDAD